MSNQLLPELEFTVNSYRIEGLYSPLELPAKTHPPTTIAVFEHSKGETLGKPHALLHFHWENSTIEEPAMHGNGIMFHLAYPISAFGGIVALLQGPGKVICRFDSNHGAIPKVGLFQDEVQVRP